MTDEKEDSGYNAARLGRETRKAIRRGRQRATQALIEWVFPSLCLLCEQSLDVPFQDAMYCWNCRRRHMTPLACACYRCGARLPFRWQGQQRQPMVDRSRTHSGCPECRRETWAFSRTVALGTYLGRWREHVYELKRRYRFTEAYQAGKMLAYPLLQTDWCRDYDGLLPMPSHFWRRWSRGFNPAQEIAAGVAQLLQLPVLTRSVSCYRYTGKQGRLTRQQRLENVRGAFCVRPGHSLKDRSLILIDDVMTTGATMNQLARECRKAGARRVAVAVVARASSHG